MTQESKGNAGGWVIFTLVLLLLVLHQDIWLWHDGRLVMGFLPVGLVWHVGISVAASLTWWLATVIAWPVDEVVEAKQTSDSENETAS